MLQERIGGNVSILENGIIRSFAVGAGVVVPSVYASNT
jgi:hypothetical protein